MRQLIVNAIPIDGIITLTNRPSGLEVSIITDSKSIVPALQSPLQVVNIDIPDFPLLSGTFQVDTWMFLIDSYHVVFKAVRQSEEAL